MGLLHRLIRSLGAATPLRANATPGSSRTRASKQPLLFVEAEFLGRPAFAGRFAERRAVIGYEDRDGQRSLRLVTFDELIDQNDHLYLSGYCHERFDRRHFRLDRIISLRRYETGEPVDPAGEVARWTGG